MEIKLLGEKRALLVKISGELDHFLAAQIRDRVDAALGASNAISIIFDFSALEFMDSSGIGVIMGRYKKTRTLGGRVIVCGVNAGILRIMEMSGIDKVIRIAPGIDAALWFLDKKKGERISG